MKNQTPTEIAEPLNNFYIITIKTVTVNLFPGELKKQYFARSKPLNSSKLSCTAASSVFFSPQPSCWHVITSRHTAAQTHTVFLSSQAAQVWNDSPSVHPHPSSRGKWIIPLSLSFSRSGWVVSLLGEGTQVLQNFLSLWLWLYSSAGLHTLSGSVSLWLSPLRLESLCILRPVTRIHTLRVSLNCVCSAAHSLSVLILLYYLILKTIQ